MPNNPRRTFLKTATAGVGALVALPATAAGQTQSAAAKTSYEVTAFGAKGDGHTLDSPAINRAIEAAAAAGGGTVSFPAGTIFVIPSTSRATSRCISLPAQPSSPQILPTVSFDLASPAASPAYDLAESNAPWESYQDFGHNHWHNSLIWGEDLENVSITGPGLIWGKGLSRGWGAGPIAEHPGVGNKAIALKNCRNVLLRDFSILHGGHFGILATGVDNLTIDNLKIDTNRDGMDIDCCRNVRVTNCSVNSPWDDAICLKSSFALGYARATEMVTISDCVVSGSYEEGTLLDATYKRFAADAKVNRTGRIKFGTESNGGFKNITITNCVFDGCWGFALETVDGGLLEDVTITNITMRDIVGAPIFLRLGARMRGPAGVPVGALRRVLISNIVVLQRRIARKLDHQRNPRPRNRRCKAEQHPDSASRRPARHPAPACRKRKRLSRALNVRHDSRARILHPPRQRNRNQRRRNPMRKRRRPPRLRPRRRYPRRLFPRHRAAGSRQAGHRLE